MLILRAMKMRKFACVVLIIASQHLGLHEMCLRVHTKPNTMENESIIREIDKAISL